MEVLRDETISPMVDRISGALSAQCIGQQVMLDIMDAIFQFSLALRAPKGQKRLHYVDLTQLRLDDLQSNVGSLRARTKRYEKIVAGNGKKPARIITADQYGKFMNDIDAILKEVDAMQLRNKEIAEKQLKTSTGTPIV